MHGNELKLQAVQPIIRCRVAEMASNLCDITSAEEIRVRIQLHTAPVEKGIVNTVQLSESSLKLRGFVISSKRIQIGHLEIRYQETVRLIINPR